MDANIEEIIKTLNVIATQLSVGFWKKADFWISTFIGISGLYFSIRAFIEAKQAKQAATDAGRTVKIQTVTIELSEISQKIDKLQPDIKFSDARDLITEISRRLRRIISPFKNDGDLVETIKELREALQTTKLALNTVRPTNPLKEDDAPRAVYHAIESNFSNISDLVADLIGSLEKKSVDFGEQNGSK